jgi:hypothetical protein
MMGKLLVVVLLMFGFGYALVPMYRAICDALGINVLSLSEQRAQGWGGTRKAGAIRRSTPRAASPSSSTPTHAGPGTSSPPCARCRSTRAS